MDRKSFASTAVRMASWLLLAIGTIALLMLILLGFVDIICRNLFNFALPGALEISQYWLMMPLVAVGLWRASVENSHVQVTILTERLGPASEMVAVILITILSAAMLFWMAWLGLEKAVEAMRQGAYEGAYKIPVWWVRYVAAAGMFAFGSMTIAHMIRKIRRRDMIENAKGPENDFAEGSNAL